MACFIVPGTEAIITTIATKVIEKKENQQIAGGVSAEQIERFSTKLKRLNGLLWGGTGLLAFEHLWHGEISAFAPFLTAMQNPADTAEMLHEMSTVGVGMAVVITAAWAGVAGVLGIIDRRDAEETAPNMTENEVLG